MRRILLALAIALCAHLSLAQRVVVIPAALSTQPIVELPTKASLQSLCAQAIAPWNDAGRGHLALTCDVADPYQLPKPRASCDDNSWEYAAAVAASNAGHVGDKTAYFFNDSLCRYGGDAAVGGSTLRITIMNVAILEHELGHSLGLNHVYGITWNGAPGDFSRAALATYVDPEEVMGGGVYVDAIDRQHLGWLIPREIARSVGHASFSVSPMSVLPDSVSLVRQDGIRYIMEIPSPGASIRLRSSFNGHSFVQIMNPGAVFDDQFGGVHIVARADGADVTYFTPPPLPTPTPGKAPVPTPAPTFGPAPPPGPTPCWILEPYVRCAATPTPTQRPATVTPTFTPPPRTPDSYFPPTATHPASATTIVPTRTLTAVAPTPTTGAPTPTATPTGPPTSTAGKVGGVLLLLAAIGAAFKKAWAWIKRKL